MANKLGDAGEQLAADYLRQHHYHLLEKNFQCRFGEIDLIMRSPEDELVFVEVKQRKNSEFSDVLESITEAKQRKLRLTAEYYLQQTNNSDAYCRFDVIAIIGVGKTAEITRLENAF